jgi:hypothetical protein
MRVGNAGTRPGEGDIAIEGPAGLADDDAITGGEEGALRFLGARPTRASTATTKRDASNATGATRSAERVTVRVVLERESLRRRRSRALLHPAASARATQSA